MSYPRCFTPRSRWASRVGRWVLLSVLTLGGAAVGRAQPSAAETADTPAAPTSPWLWLLGGVALGVLGARLWARRGQPAAGSAATAPAGAPPVPQPQPTPSPLPAPVPTSAPPGENPETQPGFQTSREEPGRPASPTKTARKPTGKGSRPHDRPKNAPAPPRASFPSTIPYRAPAMSPDQIPPPPGPDDQPLSPGQTVEWPAPAPTSTPPAVQELIAASGPADPVVPVDSADADEVSAPAPTAVPAGPVHYYAPAPDVPSIEHRKLSPQPLPQMPLLITLAHAEATTAQFSFSPQADQSRIIGNGVRELKEFFAFELPPTEQFTTITNLAPGQLEKRDDTWHVVQPARIALS